MTRATPRRRFLILAGLTGSGKTRLLRETMILGMPALDLEALAAHRGSVFGGCVGRAQPSARMFRRRLEDHLCAFFPDDVVLVEEPAPVLGTLEIPLALWRQLKASPVVWVRCSTPVRVRNLVRDYSPLGRRRLLRACERLKRRLPSGIGRVVAPEVRHGSLEAAAATLVAHYDAVYPRPKPARIVARVANDVGEDSQSAACLRAALDIGRARRIVSLSAQWVKEA